MHNGHAKTYINLHDRVDLKKILAPANDGDEHTPQPRPSSLIHLHLGHLLPFNRAAFVCTAMVAGHSGEACYGTRRHGHTFVIAVEELA